MSSIGAFYYYTTTLGKYSQAELVARQAVQTLLGLFTNQPYFINFTQALTYNPNNNTVSREVRQH